MRLLLWLAVVAPLLAPFSNLPNLARSQQPAVSQASGPSATAGSKTWIGKYQEIERFLATAEILRLEGISIGVTKPRRAFFAPGGPAGSAVVKHLPPGRRNGYWESYKSEIAAYRLDRLLDLNMVPPTVERRVDGNLMSAQLWVENTRGLKSTQGQGLSAPDTEAWNREVYRQRVFSNLVANIDVNAGNLLIDPQWNLILVDHSRCFDVSKMPFPLTRIDRAMFDRLKALDPAAVKGELGDLLSASAINGIFRRRDEIVKTFETFAKKNGEAAVFLP